MAKMCRKNAFLPTIGKLPAINKSLVLVGLMGVGKTTIGRRLAAYLRLPFVDSDEEIEKAAALTIAEIFEKMGEQTFRDGECRVIRRLLSDGITVLATGGGAFMAESTRRLIQEKAVSIWLDADINILVKRTSRRETRPLLRHGDRQKILKDLAEQRRPFYQQADIHIRSFNSSHDFVVERIIKALQSCPKRS